MIHKSYHSSYILTFILGANVPFPKTEAQCRDVS